MTGITGKVYVPEKKPGVKKKHACQDCFSCQMCSNDRCRLCRGKCTVTSKHSLELTEGEDSAINR